MTERTMNLFPRGIRTKFTKEEIAKGFHGIPKIYDVKTGRRVENIQSAEVNADVNTVTVTLTFTVRKWQMVVEDEA